MAGEARLSEAVVAALRISLLAYLAPGFRRKIDRVCERMRGEGHKPLIFETLRLAALQREYFARGTSKQRDVVRSMHCHGCAVDIICEDKQWNATAEFWDSLKRACAAEGLQWGGLWTSPVDKPHVQVGKYPGRVPDEVVVAFNRGGLAEVWKLAGVAE